MIFFEDSTDYKIFLEFKKILDSGESISARKVALGLGLKENSTRTIQRKVKEFEMLGFIERTETGRISDLTKAGKVYFGLEDVEFSENKTFSIPVLGDIACGKPIEAIEYESDRINISSDIIKGNPKDYFLLQAIGDSMDKKKIEDGDIVLIKKQSYAVNGDIVVALIDDSATLKEYKRNEKGYISLIPHSYNDFHRPIIMTENFLVLGKCIENMGKF